MGLRAHDRIIQIPVVADESADTLQMAAAAVCTYFRTRQHLIDGTGTVIPHTAGVESANFEVEFGSLLPPVTHIRLVATFQA